VILQLIACAALGLLVKLSTPLFALVPICRRCSSSAFWTSIRRSASESPKTARRGLAALVSVRWGPVLVWNQHGKSLDACMGVLCGTGFLGLWVADTLLNKFFSWVGIAFRAFFDVPRLMARHRARLWRICDRALRGELISSRRIEREES